MLRCKDIADYIEQLAPTSLAESWDNVGLLVGDNNQEIHKILITLDVTLDVVKEAVEKDVDLIISHHPMIFKPLSKITEDNIMGQMVRTLIKNNIGVYAAHTNLDIARGGLNDLLASKLNLINIKPLKVLHEQSLKKLVVFIPEGNEDRVRDAMTGAGAGVIGNYSACTYRVEGIGTFKPMEGTNPFIGKQGDLEQVKEYRLETIVPAEKLNHVVQAMIEAHPYEEVAYDVYPLDLKGQAEGIGRIGQLPEPISFKELIDFLKKILQLSHLRYAGTEDAVIKTVALCTGSGAEFISLSAKQKADVYITGDVKYHQAQLAIQEKINLIDAGHYGTENIVVPFLQNYLKDYFSEENIQILSAESNPNILKTI